MLAARILIAILFTSSLCSEWASAQERLFATNAAWHTAYENLRPKDGNELTRFRPESSLPSILDDALAASAFVRDQPPLVRAIYQRVAWRVFDSLAADSDYVDGENRALRLQLAKIISVTALTGDEISSLPNTYTRRAIGDELERNPAFDLELPEDLFDTDGSWLQLTYRRLGRIGLTHEQSRNGRSEFLLLVRFPGGRQQGKKFLESHNAFAQAQGQIRQEILNFLSPRQRPVAAPAKLPQGVRAILVERMLVVTTDNTPASTPIITSLAFIDLTPTVNTRNGHVHSVRSAAFEIYYGSLLDPQKNDSLRRLGEYEPFSGERRFRSGNQMCITCHSGNGLLSFGGGVVVPDFRTVDVVPNGAASATATWKRHEFGFGFAPPNPGDRLAGATIEARGKVYVYPAPVKAPAKGPSYQFRMGDLKGFRIVTQSRAAR